MATLLYMPPPGHPLAPTTELALRDLDKFMSEMDDLRNKCVEKPGDWALKAWAGLYAGEAKARKWGELPEASADHSWEEYKKAIQGLARKPEKGNVRIKVEIYGPGTSAQSRDVVLEQGTREGPGGVTDLLDYAVRQYLGKWLKDRKEEEREPEKRNRPGRPQEASVLGDEPIQTRPITPPNSQPTSACWYCGRSHLGSPCVRLQNYITEGSIKRNPDGRLILISGKPLPRGLKGDCYLDRVDQFYKEALASRHSDPGAGTRKSNRKTRKAPERRSMY